MKNEFSQALSLCSARWQFFRRYPTDLSAGFFCKWVICIDFFNCFILLGSEDPVAGIAKTGADVRSFIQLTIQMANIDLHIRMSLMQTL